MNNGAHKTAREIKTPFPYFGGKARVAPLVWQLLGDVPNYVEPFCGSAAVLLARPAEHKGGTETINDADGFVSNFWRATKYAPQEVAEYADWPAIETDLHARHAWLVGQRESMTEQLEGDPEWFDAKIAGWWVWGMALWIGSGFCSGEGPWHAVDGKLLETEGGDGRGVHRKRIHLYHSGRGVKRKSTGTLQEYFALLAERMRRVRVCCGDWTRVCGPTPTIGNGLTGVFLDPPYSRETGRHMDCYRVDSDGISHAVRKWCFEHGSDPRMRIVLAGYDGEHNSLEQDGWRVIKWRNHGGYANRRKHGVNENKHKERLWASPHCNFTPHNELPFEERINDADAGE